MKRKLSWIGAIFALCLMAGCSGGEETSSASANEGSTTKPTASTVADGTKKERQTLRPVGNGERDLPSPLPAADKGVVRVNIGSEPATLDPSLITTTSGSWCANHLFEPLVRMDGEGLPMPAAAESWESNEDYTVWTFNLREGMKWSNGDPVVAGDWVYAISRTLDRETNAKYAMMVFNFLDNGREYFEGTLESGQELGIRAVDDLTLEITLDNPTPFFISNVSHSIWAPQHQASIEKFGKSWHLSPESYVSNGPYYMKELRSKDRLVLERSDYFWDRENISIPQIEFLFIEDLNTEMADFIAGNLDMTGQINNREAPRMVDEPEFFFGPMIGTYYFSFNLRKPPFDDVNLRKALSKTVHRKLIVETISQRGEQPAVGLIPSSMMVTGNRSFRDVAPPYYDYEDFGAAVEEAKKILADAGYGKPGKPIPDITYIYNKELIHGDIADNIQNIWNTVFDIDMAQETMEFGVLLDRGRKGDFQIMRSSWIGDYFDPITFLEIFETGHGNNYAGYSNPVYDDLLAKIRSETDAEKRLEYIVEAERLLVDVDCVIAPVFEYVTPILVRTDLKGFIRTPLGGLDLTKAHRVGEE